VLVALTLSACSVGQGVGEASGPSNILSCHILGRTTAIARRMRNSIGPGLLQLNPDFFCGEPINQLTSFPTSGSPPLSGSLPLMNRITIRLQHSGKQVENTDALFFDVVNSYEVARCVRGREIAVPGQPTSTTMMIATASALRRPGLHGCAFQK